MSYDRDFRSVQDVCSAINDKAARLSADALRLRNQKRAAMIQIKQQPASPGIVPSGPRKRGEGCDDEDQGIVAADETQNGGARIRVTLLTAGFLIGPGGASIRAVSQKSGAEIRSWSENFMVGSKTRKVRTIVIEGSHRSVVLGLAILSEAVERYKELCEGKYCGKTVDRVQLIRGVEFFYSPPPRSAVPFAAALRPERSAGSSPSEEGSFRIPGHFPDNNASPASMAQKENLAAAIAAAKSAAATAHGQSLGPIFESVQLDSSVFTPSNLSATIEGASVPASAARASALAAAFAATGSTGQALLPLNVNSMAPPTPFAMQGYYIDGTIAVNQEGEYVQVPPQSAGDAGKIHQLQNRQLQQQQLESLPGSLAYAAAVQGLNAEEYNSSAVQENAAVQVSQQQESAATVPAPMKQVSKADAAVPMKEYSLFGPCLSGDVFGPQLLRGIWDSEAVSPRGSPSSGWRGMPAVAVADDQLSRIGMPSYAQFAEKYEYYTQLPAGDVPYPPGFSSDSIHSSMDSGAPFVPGPGKKGLLTTTTGGLLSAFENSSDGVIRQ